MFSSTCEVKVWLRWRRGKNGRDLKKGENFMKILNCDKIATKTQKDAGLHTRIEAVGNCEIVHCGINQWHTDNFIAV